MSTKAGQVQFCAGVDQGTTHLAILALVGAGLMIARNVINEGRSQYFQVTEAGQRLVAAMEPPPKKQTRSQQRDQRFLLVADVMSFREWLAYEAAERRGPHAQ